MSIDFHILRLLDFHFLLVAAHESFKLQHLFIKGPVVHSKCTFAGPHYKQSLQSTDHHCSDMAVNDGELCDQVLAFVLVEDHVFLSGASNKKVRVSFFGFVAFLILLSFVLLVGLEQAESIIISNAGISHILFVFITFLVLVVFVMQRVIQTETVYITISTCAHQLSVIVRNADILNII